MKESKDFACRKRLFIGGLTASVTQDELKQRMEPFGRVESVEIPKCTRTGQSRGFAFVSIKISELQLSKCMAAYNKSRWKGMQLSIEKAKTSSLHRRECERKEQVNMAQMERNKWMRITEQMKTNTMIVTDDNMEGREHWKRRRYGRAVRIMHMRKPGSTKMSTLDPSRFKLGLYKFNVDIPDISVNQLTWPTSSFDAIRPVQESSVEPTAEASSIMEGIEYQDQSIPHISQSHHVERNGHKVHELCESKETVLNEIESEENVQEMISDVQESILHQDNHPVPGVEINSNLKELVGGQSQNSTALFSLFDDSKIPIESTGFVLSEPTLESLPLVPEVTSIPNLSTKKFFFLHLNDPQKVERHESTLIALTVRSLFEKDGCFVRKEEVPEIVKRWEETRQELTDDYKKKRRAATKKKVKILRHAK